MHQKMQYIILLSDLDSTMTRELRESEPKECPHCGCHMWIKERNDGGSILMREEIIGVTCVRCDMFEAMMVHLDKVMSR